MLASLIHLFFPEVCAGCDALLRANENSICVQCRHNIPLTQHHLHPENDAFRKFYGRIPVEFAGAFVYFHKKGIVQKLIHQLKYRGMEEIGSVFGHWFAPDLQTVGILASADEIIPVPLHRRKLRQRGYNQVTTFGQALSENLRIPLNGNLLVRTRYSKTQTRKNLLGRTEVGSRQIFDVVFSETDTNKHFILIDDVLTTGSTLEACSRALLKIPGARISIVCMSMSH